MPKASVFGFLGPNGAGKTTTIRAILGLIKPASGTIHIHGYDLHKDRRHALAQIGAIVETPTLYPHLTGQENLEIARRLSGKSPSAIDAVLEFVSMTGVRHRLVREYSLGMRQRLAIARALIGEPRLLILDEPTNGLDPVGIVEMRSLIKSLPERFGTTVFVSSHLLNEIEQIVDNCALIENGHLRFQGSLSSLLQRMPGELVVSSLEPENTHLWISQHGLHPKADDDGAISIEYEGSIRERSDLLRAMINEGIAVTDFHYRKPDLERIFLTLTNRNESHTDKQELLP